MVKAAASSGLRFSNTINYISLIKKVPKTQRGGSAAQQNRDTIVRSAFIRLLEKFEENEQRVIDVEAGLSANVLTTTAPASAEKALCWERASTTRIGSIDSKRKAKILVTATQGELSPAIIRGMVKKDDAIIEAMFSLFTSTSDGLRLPEVCLNKQVAEEFFLERVSDVGHRWRGWVIKAVNNSEVAWNKGGPYELVFDASDVARSVNHIGGQSALLPTKVLVDKTFKLKYPHDEEEATLVSDDMLIQIKLNSLFSKDPPNGPWRHIIPKEKALYEHCSWNALVVKYERRKKLDDDRLKAGANVIDDLDVLDKDEETKRKIRGTAAAKSARTKKVEKRVTNERSLKLVANAKAAPAVAQSKAAGPVLLPQAAVDEAADE
jgi:hypothetical protein